MTTPPTKNNAPKRPTIPAIKKTVNRAQKLVDSLMDMMEMRIDSCKSGEQWETLFDSKDGAVLSMQKLVQLIGLLAAQIDAMVPARTEPNYQSVLSRAEIEMLSDWLLAGEGQVEN